MASELRSKLIHLHIEYDMNLVSTQNLKKTIQNEIDAYLEFSWDKKFSTVFPKEKSEARIKEIIKKAALSEEIIELLKKGINAN